VVTEAEWRAKAEAARLFAARDRHRARAAARTRRHSVRPGPRVRALRTARPIDAFNVTPYLIPGGLSDIVDLLVPELQERGVRRTEYTGTTLRDHLGLRALLGTRPRHMVDKKLSHPDRNAAASGARSGLT
jgi:hypothetical protein